MNPKVQTLSTFITLDKGTAVPRAWGHLATGLCWRYSLNFLLSFHFRSSLAIQSPDDKQGRATERDRPQQNVWRLLVGSLGPDPCGAGMGSEGLSLPSAFSS